MSNHGKGLLIVGLGVATISPDSLVVRLVDMSPSAILFWRGLLTSIGFFALACILYRRETGARFASVGRADLAIGALSAISSTLFVTAVTHTAVANTLVILAASPVFAAVLSSVFLGDRITPVTWAACIVILAGVAVIVWANMGGSNLTGDLAAFAGTLSIAGTFVVLRSKPGLDAVPGLTMGGLLTALAVAPVAAGGLVPSAHDLVLLLLLGIVILPAALGLITRGPAYLTAPEIGLIMLLETILGPLWVWMKLGEQPSRASVWCGALIVCVLAVHSILALRGEASIDGAAQST